MTKEKLVTAIRAMPEEEFDIRDLIERIGSTYKIEKDENLVAEKEASIAGTKYPNDQD